MAVYEDIVIRISTVVDNFKAGMDKATTNFRNLQKVSKEVGGSFATTATDLDYMGMKLNDVGEIVDKYTDDVVDQGKAMNQLRKSAKRFRMEFLSVMFLGMQMQRVYQGLTKTSMEWMGTTEVMGAILGVMFLPIAEVMLNILLWLWDAWNNLSEPMQKFITWGVFVIGAIGTIIFWFGMLSLGIAGVGKAFAFLGPISGGVFTGMGANIKSFMGSLLKWMPLIAFVGYFIYKTFQNSGGAIVLNNKANLARQEKDWESYSMYVLARNSVIEFGIAKTFMNIYETAMNIIYGLVKGVLHLFEALASGVVTLVLTPFRWLFLGLERIASALGLDWLADKFSDAATNVTNSIDDINAKIAEGFGKGYEGIEEQQQKFIEKMGKGYENLNWLTMQRMIEMGLPFEDVIETMKKQGMEFSDIVEQASLSGKSWDYINSGIEKYKSSGGDVFQDDFANNTSYLNAELQNQSSNLDDISNTLNQTGADMNSYGTMTQSSMDDVSSSINQSINDYNIYKNNVQMSMSDIGTSLTTGTGKWATHSEDVKTKNDDMKTHIDLMTKSVYEYITSLTSIPALVRTTIEETRITKTGWGGFGFNFFQHGGIVTRPQLGMLGESGPEAVIPLSKLGNMGNSVTIENPTIYINSMVGRDSTETIVREVIDKLGTRLVRVI